MAEAMDRREFLKMSGGASAGVFLANFRTDASLFERPGPAAGPVRIGVIGTGNRGRSLLANLLLMPGSNSRPSATSISTRSAWLRTWSSSPAGPSPKATRKGPRTSSACWGATTSTR